MQNQSMGSGDQMGKRATLAFILSFLVIFGYSYFYSKNKPPQTPPQSQEIEKQGAQSLSKDLAERERPRKTEPETWPEEKTAVLENNLLKATFSSLRGSIRSLVLKKGPLIRDEEVTLVNFQNPDVQPGSLSRVGDFDHRALLTYQISETNPDSITFEARDGNLLIRKKFTMTDRYAIQLEVQFVNEGKEPVSFYRGYDVSMGSMKAKDPDESLRPVEVDYFLAGGEGAYLKKPIGKIKDREVLDQDLSWVAMKSKYFALILKPLETSGFALLTESVEENFQLYYTCGIRMSSFQLDPGQSKSASFFVFCGPKEYHLLKSFNYHLESLLDFEGVWGGLSHGLLISLRALNKIFHNYGIAIIILTILLKLIFYPLTAVSLKSMKEMQALKPQLDEIKKKYKDPKKVQQATMELYKEHNVKPLAGCLPMLIQIPIFIAFYKVLMVSIELRGADFLWIKDLAKADTIIKLGGGFPLNILPILNGATMFWQQSFSQVDPSQKKTMLMMPILMTVLFYNLPSGLILYWLITTLITVLQQYQIQKSPTKLLKEGK